MFLSYVLGASFVSIMFRHLPTSSVFDLQFLYGPLIRNIVTSNVYASADLVFTAHRMPFIPYFLSAIAVLHDDVFLASVVKNLLFCSITFLALSRWVRHGGAGGRRERLLAILLVASFPQFVFWAVSPDADEGYIIHLMAALSVGLFTDTAVSPRRWATLTALALLNAVLYLTKSSMLPVSVGFWVMYWVKSADLKVAGVFGGFLLCAVVLWGSMNLRHSGTFAINTSLDGWNLYKGNNEAALLLYPKYNLDIADDEGLTAWTRPAGTGEWEFNSAARGKAVEFALNHPIDELRLLGRRVFVFFLEIRRNPVYRGEGHFDSPLYWLGTLYMAAFRAAFLGSIWLGVRRLREYRKERQPGRREAMIRTIFFFTMLAAYAVPYLVGFTSERHLMPLVIPTLMYWFSIRERAIGGQRAGLTPIHK